MTGRDEGPDEEESVGCQFPEGVERFSQALRDGSEGVHVGEHPLLRSAVEVLLSPQFPRGWTSSEGQLNENHLRWVLREFIEEYYHMARPHQGLGGDTPIATESPPDLDGPTTLVATPVLGGLHHRYERQAA